MSGQYTINEATFTRSIASLTADARDKALARFRSCENDAERFALLRECLGGKLTERMHTK